MYVCIGSGFQSRPFYIGRVYGFHEKMRLMKRRPRAISYSFRLPTWISNTLLPVLALAESSVAEEAGTVADSFTSLMPPISRFRTTNISQRKDREKKKVRS